MATEERVLCFERKLFENLGVFQGLTLEVERYLPVITSASQLVYLNRSDAENDRRYKQLIPYVLLLCHDKILRYQRGKRGQETRLHGLFSVGIGGHISEEDHGLFSNDRGYQESMRRELMEEVAVDAGSEPPVAAINDDMVNVGFLVIGIFLLVWVASVAIYRWKGGDPLSPLALKAPGQ